jgi:hypothetical protein
MASFHSMSRLTSATEAQQMHEMHMARERLNTLVRTSDLPRFIAIVDSMDLDQIFIDLNHNRRVPYGNILLETAIRFGMVDKVHYLLADKYVNPDASRRTGVAGLTSGPLYEAFASRRPMEVRVAIISDLIKHGATFGELEKQEARFAGFSEALIAQFESYVAEGQETKMRNAYWIPRRSILHVVEGSQFPESTIDDPPSVQYLFNEWALRDILTNTEPKLPRGGKRYYKKQKGTKKTANKKSKNTRKH